MVKKALEKEEIQTKQNFSLEMCDHRIKLLAAHVKKIQFLIENEPYEDEHKTLNKMLKIRYDEIDSLKKTRKINQDIQILEKKLEELKKEKAKLN